MWVESRSPLQRWSRLWHGEPRSSLTSSPAPRSSRCWWAVGLIFLVGFWDDTHPIKATTKFALQVGVAAVVFFAGVRIMGVGFGDVWFSQLTAIAAFVVTVTWIVGTTNAFNLIDGSDGVAGGAALFASLAMGIIFALHADPVGALMATILVGACLGFLFFNFPPASVFMGDCGALFLGFTLATLGVITTHKSSTLIAITIPVIAFGVPLLDTIIAIVRRYLRHEPIFAPDRGTHPSPTPRSGNVASPRGHLLLCSVRGLRLTIDALGGPGAVLRSSLSSSSRGAVLILGVQRLNVPELTELSRALGRGPPAARRDFSQCARTWSSILADCCEVGGRHRGCA